MNRLCGKDGARVQSGGFSRMIAGFSFMLLSEGVMYIPFLSGQTKAILRTLLHVVWHFLSLGVMAQKAVTLYRKEERLYEWLARKALGIVD